MALDAIRGEQPIAQLAARHGVHQAMINAWRKQAIEGMSGVFSGKAEAAREGEIDQLHAKIDQVVVQQDFFATRLRSMSAGRRREDDRTQPPDTADHAPVRLGRHPPFSVLRRPVDRERGEPGVVSPAVV